MLKNQSRDFVLFLMALCGVVFADTLSKTSTLDKPKVSPNPDNIDHICRLIAGIPTDEDHGWLKAQGFNKNEFSGYSVNWTEIDPLDSSHSWMDPYQLLHTHYNHAGSKEMVKDFMQIVPDSLSRAAVLCELSTKESRKEYINNMNLLGKGWDVLLVNAFLNHMVFEPVELRTQSDACAEICIDQPAPAENIFSHECTRYFGFGAISDAVLLEALINAKYNNDPALLNRLKSAFAAHLERCGDYARITCAQANTLQENSFYLTGTPIPAARIAEFNNTAAIQHMENFFGIDKVAVSCPEAGLNNEERFAILALYLKNFKIFAQDPTYQTSDGHHNSVGRTADGIVRLAMQLQDVKLLSMLKDTAFAITHMMEASEKYSKPKNGFVYVDDFYVFRRYNQHILPAYEKAIADAKSHLPTTDATQPRPRFVAS